MEIKSNIGGKIGTFKAQAYLDGDMALDGAELNSLYTGLLNTKMYLLGTANDSYVKS